MQKGRPCYCTRSVPVDIVGGAPVQPRVAGPEGHEPPRLDQSVHVEVGLECLLPGVQEQDAPELAAQIVVAELQQRLAGGPKQQSEKPAFVGEDEGREGLRETPTTGISTTPLYAAVVGCQERTERSSVQGQVRLRKVTNEGGLRKPAGRKLPRSGLVQLYIIRLPGFLLIATCFYR